MRLAAFLAALLLPASGALGFDLQGHRGARGLAPENTLPGFVTALRIGVTTLELDVGVTRDGVVVVHHNRGLNPDTTRGPDGRWLEKPGPPIYSLRYDQLRAYDVGRLNPASAYAKNFPQQKPVDGARIPRLEEVFALVRRNNAGGVRFSIETKISPDAPDETPLPAELARALLAEIRIARVEKRTIIQSFDWRTLEVVQKEAPEIPTLYLSEANASAQGPLPPRVKAAGGKIWSPDFRSLDAAQLKQAHDLGLQVIPWTVNQPADIARVIELGVDGIISDRPDLVREELQRRGMPLPPAIPASL